MAIIIARLQSPSYVAARRSNEASSRLSWIPQNVREIFERIFTRLRDAVVRARDDGSISPDYLKFFDDLYTGRFANLPTTQQRVEMGQDIGERLGDAGMDGALERSVAYRVDPDRALNTIKNFDDVLRGNKRRTIIAKASEDLSRRIMQETGVYVAPNANYELSNGNAIHINNRHITNQTDVNPLSDIDIAEMPYVLESPDVIKRGKKVRGQQRIEMHKNMSNGHIAVVEVIKKGNALEVVTYFNDSSSGRPNVANATSGYTSETGQIQSTNLDNTIPNPNQNVNPGENIAPVEYMGEENVRYRRPDGTPELDQILAHYKQFPRSVDIDLLKNEYANDPQALAAIDQAVAEAKQAAKEAKATEKRAGEYFSKMNELAAIVRGRGKD